MSAAEDVAVAAVDGGAVGRFAEAVTWASLPPEVRRRGTLALRDTVGTMIGGRDTLAALAAGRAAALDESSGPVHLVTTGERVGRTTAALANGVAASCLDFDDGHVLGGSIHPGGAIVPALLATASGRDLRVGDLVAGLVVAYEVGIRAGYLLWPEDRSHQAHLAGTPAAIGGAVGCARLLGLDAPGLRRALEIGWAHAPLAALQFPMVKESLGWAAATSVAAAQLAAAGFKDAGPAGSDAFGYADHPPTGFDRPTAGDDPFAGRLGERWEISSTYFKPYAACRFTHTAADAMLRLAGEGGFAAADIEAIVVHTHREAAYLDGRRPSTLEEAQYSFPWVVAAAALDGEVGPDQLRPEALVDPERIAMSERVRVVHDRKLDPAYPAAYPSRVEVHANGATFTSQVDVALGSPERPLGEDALAAKFLGLATPALGDAAGELVAVLDDPERPVGELFALLERVPPAAAS